jgi:hypothetical protein
MSARLALLCFALTVSCRVPAVDGAAYSGPRNSCDLGCATGVGCVDGACAAAETAYPLVFEVTPEATSTFAPGVTYTLPIDDRKGGTGRNLNLAEPARVVAELPDDTGVTLRLRKVDAVPGAAPAVYEASSLPGSTLTRVLTILPGKYEVFLTPSNDAALAFRPAVQLRDDETGLPLQQTFTSGGQKLVVSYAGLRSIEVSLTDGTGKPLVSPLNEARDVFVMDDTSRTLASTIARTCVLGGTELQSDVKLTLAPALTGHRYTLRVAPAAKPCSAAPGPLATVDFDLQALDVEGHGNRAVLAMPPTNRINTIGQVVAFGTNAPINDATVILRSQQLDDTTDGHAFLETRVPIGGAGGQFFTKDLLAGTYRATVIPGSGLTLGSKPYAICVDCTTSAQDPSAPPGTRIVDFKLDGKNSVDFQIARRVAVTVAAAGFDGALFGLGTFESDTSSSASLATTTGATLLTRSELGPIAITQEKTTGKTWNVSAALDPGAYDIVVRTPEASGYPWVVLPAVEVAPAPKLDLGVVKAAAPVIFAGRLLDPSGQPVPRALLRARALIADKTDPKKPPLGAVLVAETRTGEDGSYRVVVPSDFSAITPTTK